MAFADLQPPPVVIATRSKARGELLTHRLGQSGGVNILQAVTSTDALIDAMVEHPQATLLMDSGLEETSGEGALLRIALRQPVASVALTTVAVGEFAVSMVRAGASDVLLWENSVERIDAVVTALQNAAAVGPLGLQAWSSTRTPGRGKTRLVADAGTVVVFLGALRARLFTEVVERFDGSVPVAWVCRQPVHESMRVVFEEHLVRTGRVPLSQPARRRVLSAGYGYITTTKIAPGILRDEEGWAWKNSLVGPNTQAGESQWLATIGSEWQNTTRSLVFLVHGSLSQEELSAVNLQMQAGAAIGRVVPGGFELRWRGQQGASLLAFDDFWGHFAEHVADGGRRAPDVLRPEIWPRSDSSASARQEDA